MKLLLAWVSIIINVRTEYPFNCQPYRSVGNVSPDLQKADNVPWIQNSRLGFSSNISSENLTFMTFKFYNTDTKEETRTIYWPLNTNVRLMRRLKCIFVIYAVLINSLILVFGEMSRGSQFFCVSVSAIRKAPYTGQKSQPRVGFCRFFSNHSTFTHLYH